MTHHFAAVTMLQGMIPLGILKPPFLGLLCFFADLKSPGGMCQPHPFLRKPHGWQKRGYSLCVWEHLCGNSHPRQMCAPVCG